MAKTKIDWADKVWNPVTGCTKISDGCKNCYAERMSKRLAGRYGYPADKPFRVTLHPEKLDEPLKWKTPQKVFVCSMGDLFHEDMPIGILGAFFNIIANTPQHTYIILTKRPERMKIFFDIIYRAGIKLGKVKVPNLKKDAWRHVAAPLANLWFGVTVENQQAADERIPSLLQIPAVKRFISIEPMLGPVDLRRLNIYGGWLDSLRKDSCAWLDWVILGGETGPKARPMHTDWVRSVRDQCQATGTPFFFKSWGEWKETGIGGTWPGDICMSADGFIDVADKDYVCFANESEGVHLQRVGKKLAGHLLDGKEYREWPE